MKPETSFIAGLLVYFATTALNRFLGERSYGSLPPEDKQKLADSFSTHRSLATYIPIGIMVAILGVGYWSPWTLPVVFPVGVALVLIVSLAIQISIFRHLKDLAPHEYVAKFRTQSILVQIGNIVALSLMAWGVAAGIK